MRATIFKTLLPVIALAFSLASSVQAKSDISGFGSIPQKEIFNLAKYPKLDFQKINKIYKQKCDKHILDFEGCFITEKDIDPKGSPNQVLLFRGEAKQFSQPATSSYFRYYSKDKSHCPQGCSEQILQNKFEEDIRGMQVDSRLVENRQATYFHAPGEWSAADPERLAKTRYPFLEVSVHHLLGRSLYFKNGGSNFDPFVSFSTSPEVARSFASEVIIVASVPAASVLLLTEDECMKSTYEQSEFYMLAMCTGYFAMTLEREVSAMFFLPQQYLYSIIVKP